MEIIHSDIARQFQAAMQAAGIGIDEAPIADGALHRFKVEGDKNGSNNGWYVLYGDNNPKGCFGSWKLAKNETWSLKQFTEYTPKERIEWKQQQAKAQQERQEAKALEHEKASNEANNIWNNAQPETGDHKYLKDKHVKAHSIKTNGQQLVIPLHNTCGVIHSLQYINPDGSKKFLTGGAIKGHYFSLGVPENTLVIVEGYSTGASIYEATGYAVAITFNAGNLQAVAKALHEKLPSITLIIAGDDDQWTDGNPGKRCATEAATAVDGKLIIPNFTNTESKPTDFNDLHQLEGLEIVKQQIEAAAYVENEKQETIGPMTAADNTVKKLAALPVVKYEQIRKKEAKLLNMRVSALDDEVEATRKNISKQDSEDSIISDVDPWPHKVDGNQLLTELQNTFRRYSIIPDGAEIALPLWVLGTYVFNLFRIFPMIGLVSPEKRCGKSTVLTLLKALCCKSILASNISAAAIYRVIEAWQPTLLIDEADTFLKDNDEMRGIINSGHTKDTAYVIRTEGDNHEPKKFSTWAPKAIAMIGDMPDTNKDRSLVITMRRRRSGEQVDKITLDLADDCLSLRQKCLRWALDHQDEIIQLKTTLPDIGNDRALDNWTPMATLAEIIGGDWKQQAIRAMETISGNEDDENIGMMLLSDIRMIFENKNIDRIFSEDLVMALIELEDRPWCEWRRGNPLSKNSLARLLKPYKIKSKSIRIGVDNFKGYPLDNFKDVFSSYLPQPPFLAVQSVTTSQLNGGVGCSQNQSVTDTMRVTDANVTDTMRVTDENTRKANGSNGCDVVTDANPNLGGLGEGIINTIERVEI